MINTTEPQEGLLGLEHDQVVLSSAIIASRADTVTLLVHLAFILLCATVHTASHLLVYLLLPKLAN